LFAVVLWVVRARWMGVEALHHRLVRILELRFIRDPPLVDERGAGLARIGRGPP